MSKRFQPIKEFSRPTKKPKLDITINKSRPEISKSTTSTNNTNNNQRNAGYSNIPTTSRNIALRPSPNAFWDDDDDDVILLATQVAETRAAAAEMEQRMPTASTTFTESEITFSEFVPNGNGKTSTQQTVLPPRRNNDILSNMFDDDDDFDFLAVDAAEKASFKAPAVPPLPANNIRMPSTHNIEEKITASIETTTTTLDTTAPPAIDAMSLQTQSIARRQLASERQIKFLMERIDGLKKENTKLTNEISDSKAKMQSKEGESSLLRDELRHLKQQIQALKMEKIFNTEAAKTECKTKIDALSKQVVARETELKLKSVEYSLLKMRHADETKRFELSMRNDSILGTQHMPGMEEAGTSVQPAKNKTFSKNAQRKLLRMRNLQISEMPMSTDLNGVIFEETKKLHFTIFQSELEALQSIVAHLQLRPTEQELERIIARLVESVCKAFPEFWSYAHSLEFQKNSVIYPNHNYELQHDTSDEHMRKTILQPNALYLDENALNLRRYFAILAFICRQLPQLTDVLMQHRHGEYLLLQIVNEAIAKLGFSNEVCEHFGLLESCAAFLHSLLSNCTVNIAAAQTELLGDLLKQLIFTRPSAWIFHELSFCMLACRRLPQVISLMCVNSAKQTFVTDRVGSIYRFSPDSCLLQVYAGLLENAFPTDIQLRPKHFDLLTVICCNHVRFIYYCFTNQPKFIQSKLPNFDDEFEEQDNTTNSDADTIMRSSSNVQPENESSSTSSTSNTITTTMAQASLSEERNCECYTKLCLSVVTLIFQLLRQWLLTDKMLATSQVGVISQISVQLLNIIFRDYYQTCLFREAEETTKHYLALICKWWSENAIILQFKQIHLRFLKQLQDMHFMPKSINEEENLLNLTNDLEKWHRITKNVDTAEPMQENINTDRFDPLMEAQTASFFDGLKGYAFNFE